jgi:hypothetical protein
LPAPRAGPVAVGDQVQAATIDRVASAQAGPVAGGEQDSAQGDQVAISKAQAATGGRAANQAQNRASMLDEWPWSPAMRPGPEVRTL